MKMVTFLNDETGTITVDWAVLSAAVAVMALATVGVLSSATNSFSEYNERELAMQNASGLALLDSEGYIPANGSLFDAYVGGLAELTLDQLDAVAGYANRLHAMGYADNLAASGAINVSNCTAAQTSADCGGIHGMGADGDLFGGEFSLSDFLVAVDAAYAARGQARPTHTRIDRFAVDAAFAEMGLSQNEIAALWSV